MMFRIVLAVLLAVLPGVAGFGALGAEELGPRLRALADAAVAEERVTGIVVGVVRDGAAPTLAAAGLANRERRLAMTPDIGFKTASIAKTFLAALALQLAEERKLALDDRLARFLPDVPNAERVTLRQLLDHTSGYDDYITDSFANAAHARPGRVWTPRELLAYAEPKRLRFRPGERYDYSNTNYLLLGMALEVAAGRPAALEIRRRFFDPLGLAHSWFASVEPVPAGRLAHGYAELGDGGMKQDVTAEPAELSGADGALVSNAPDLLAWAKALFGGRVLPPARLDEMLSFVTPPEEEGTPGSGYGLGVERLRVDGVTFYGHTGSAPGYNGLMLYQPATRVAIVLALNEDPDDEALLDILGERVVHALEESGSVRFPRASERAVPPAGAPQEAQPAVKG